MIMSKLWRVFSAVVFVVLISGCGVTVIEGTFDPDAVQIDERLLLEVDEEILEAEEASNGVFD